VQRNATTTIIEEYEKQCGLYSAFTEKIEKLTIELIKENGLRVHSITSRVKTRDSLKAKVAASERQFSKISDVPDVSGIRIITYFDSDVDSVAKVIEKEFDVDREHSVDKRKLLDPDRFGYLSLHYVVRLPASRLQLTEYKRFAKCQAEIQIRSILQHAWAEIEHDLGYKGKYAVPSEIRRRFSRLAGLLEIADTEFGQIRDSLQEYERTVSQQIIDAPASVLINKGSLLSFVKSNPLVHEIDNKIASIAGGSRIIEDEGFISRQVDKLHYVGLKSIADLNSSLTESREIVVAFAKLWFDRKYKTLNASICLVYLLYVLVARKKSVTGAYNYLKAFDIGPPEDRKIVAKELISTYSKACV